MGGRGSVSMTRRTMSLTQIQDKLVTNGRISLNVDDYKGVAGSTVRDLFAAQDYEIFAIFNDKDEVINIQSQFNSYEVTADRRIYRVAIRKDGGTRFTDFHNHPVDIDSIQIYSPEDIKAYVDYIPKNKGKTTNNPTVFTVQTQTGSKFTLTYTGKKISRFTKPSNFASAYSKKFHNQLYKYSSSNHISRIMIRWLAENASKYGFEFEESLFKPYRNRMDTK